MQKTPFKNINWFSFYDQMNTDFRFFIKSVKMAVKYFSKNGKFYIFGWTLAVSFWKDGQIAYSY